MPSPTGEPLGRLFLRFLRFGALAWGGPVAQIAMLQRELVEEEGWIERERFNRTLALYQVLPGPEASELCVFFGMLARGRLGGLVAGLGFVLPGFLLMLALAWGYLAIGLGSPVVLAVFAGFQAGVIGIVARAVHRIAKHALLDGWLAASAACALAASLADVHFAITLGLTGFAQALVARRRRALACVLLAGLLAIALARVATTSADAEAAQPRPAAIETPSTPRLFASGLKAGLLTFGGAYTAIPFLREDAVEHGHWLTPSQFLDGLALGGILPAPLVIFATFIGFLAGALPGALAMTAGIYLPAFGMTLAGHAVLEKIVANRAVHGFLDGVAAGVVGLVAATLATLVRSGLTSVPALIICAASLVAAFGLRGRASVAIIVLGSGALGWLMMR